MLFQIMYVDPRQALEEALRTHPSLAAQAPAKAADAEARETETRVLDRLAPVIMFHPATEDDRVHAKSFSFPETFTIWLKASLVVGTILSSPWVFYQIWSFVAAGLYPHEKRYIHLFLPFSLGLFLLGAATAYLLVFKPVLSFLLTFNSSLGIDPDPRISEWLGFVMMLPLGFGISFQLPLVMLFLDRIGIFSVRMYLEKWRVAVLVIFIISAVLTPADPYSILFMALPLTFLYFGGVAVCKFLPAHSSSPERPAGGLRHNDIARGLIAGCRCICAGQSRITSLATVPSAMAGTFVLSAPRSSARMGRPDATPWYRSDQFSN